MNFIFDHLTFKIEFFENNPPPERLMFEYTKKKIKQSQFMTELRESQGFVSYSTRELFKYKAARNVEHSQAHSVPSTTQRMPV